MSQEDPTVRGDDEKHHIELDDRTADMRHVATRLVAPVGRDSKTGTARRF